ncbi:MAG: ABC transporter ATP-binding protein, partial [archaeon]
QKLLNIAISLIHDPEIIFMDEPTVGLDPTMRQLFWNKIVELKKNGKTIILTTHYMDEAEELCNRVALLKNGKLIAIGKPVDLIKQHGGIKVVVFRLSKPPVDLDIEMIRMMAASKNVVVQGNMLIIPFSQEDSIKRLAGITELLMKKGYNIISSTEKEPDLEDVFLNIVGENMGD